MIIPGMFYKSLSISELESIAIDESPSNNDVGFTSSEGRCRLNRRASPVSLSLKAGRNCPGSDVIFRCCITENFSLTLLDQPPTSRRHAYHGSTRKTLPCTIQGPCEGVTYCATGETYIDRFSNTVVSLR